MQESSYSSQPQKALILDKKIVSEENVKVLGRGTFVNTPGICQMIYSSKVSKTWKVTKEQGGLGGAEGGPYFSDPC